MTLAVLDMKLLPPNTLPVSFFPFSVLLVIVCVYWCFCSSELLDLVGVDVSKCVGSVMRGWICVFGVVREVLWGFVRVLAKI